MTSGENEGPTADKDEPVADHQDQPAAQIQDTSLRDIPVAVRILIGALFATGMATRAQLVALGLLVFDITGRELDLGLLGLAEFLPIFLLSPFTGTVADRYAFTRRSCARHID